MEVRSVARGSAVALAFSALAALALGNEPVPTLQDLVGVKGAAAETSLTSRGYEFLGLGQGVRKDYAYWRSKKTNDCVGVQQGDGRVRAVVFAPSAQCQAAAANKPTAPAPTAAGFSTVCGVTADGKEYRYKCTVEGAAPGGPGQTVVHFPDNKVALKWLGAGQAAATFEGMNPQNVAVTTAGGFTRFSFEGKPYFYVSDRNAAATQLKTLR